MLYGRNKKMFALLLLLSTYGRAEANITDTSFESTNAVTVFRESTNSESAIPGAFCKHFLAAYMAPTNYHNLTGFSGPCDNSNRSGNPEYPLI